jgi:hypothetical protein
MGYHECIIAILACALPLVNLFEAERGLVVPCMDDILK